MVPAASPAIVVDVPVPEDVTPPGVLIRVHVPVAGSPFKATLAVATVQVGCVMVPTVGADGVCGWTLTTILAEAGEVQPSALVTV